VGAFLGAYRWLFLAASLALFAVGFVWMKRHRALWIAGAVVTLLAATAPSYAASLFASPAGAPAGERRAYVVEGIDCEACAGPIIAALTPVTGVAGVRVVVADQRVEVVFAQGVQPNDAAIVAALDDLGYEGRRDGE
jgi:copper chaperone CopZ